MNRLANQVAVVTGGTSGIGLAVAQGLVAEGAQVVVFARSEAGLASTLKTLGPSAHGVSGSVDRAADVERLFQETKRRFAGVDFLFANAAVVKLAPVSDTTETLFNEIVGVNLKGAFDTLRLASAMLNPRASVVITTSWLHQVGFPGAGLVAMTKGALRSLVRVAAAELAPRGIRVNAVSPGAIQTLSPANFRVRLARARGDLRNWMHRRCGLVNDANPCRCPKKARGYVQRGVVDPEHLVFNTDYVVRIESVARRGAGRAMDRVDDLYQQVFLDHPYQLSKARIVEEILRDDTVRTFFDLGGD